MIGFENNEFGVPRLTANGALLRINYQIDGSNNTQKDRAGLRQMPMSEVMIREVKVVTTGYAPEFGQTMGMVYNAITPSGTNAFQGPGQLPVPAASRWSARSRSSSAAPRSPPTADTGGERDKPETKSTPARLVGGPVIKNKTHSSSAATSRPSATCRELA